MIGQAGRVAVALCVHSGSDSIVSKAHRAGRAKLHLAVQISLDVIMFNPWKV